MVYYKVFLCFFLFRICWERAVLFSFRLYCFTLCHLNCLYSFPVWCQGRDLEFLIIAFSIYSAVLLIPGVVGDRGYRQYKVVRILERVGVLG